MSILSHYLTPNWPAPDHVRAVTSLRFSGHSQGPFDSFNLSTAQGDDPAAVQANRQQLRKELNLSCEPAWLHQVHSKVVVAAETVLNTAPAADASITTEPQVACAVLTADCLPILLCNTAGSQVAAIHAGWRGILAGVISATLARLHGDPKQWLAWLGPAIGPTAFEVGSEVHQAFLAKDPAAHSAFQPKPQSQTNDQWLANIYLLAQHELRQQGLSQIFGGEYCTYSDPERFFSYRRDQGNTGRMVSLIMRT